MLFADIPLRRQVHQSAAPAGGVRGAVLHHLSGGELGLVCENPYFGRHFGAVGVGSDMAEPVEEPERQPRLRLGFA